MTILKCLFYIHRQDNPDKVDLYGSVTDDLRAEIHHILQREAGEPVALDSWPEGDWLGGLARTSTSEWTAKTVAPACLLQAEVQFSPAGSGVRSSVKLMVGKTDDEKLVVVEERHAEAFSGRISPDMLPRLSFLDGYCCKDEDGYRTDGMYVVERNRIAKFVAFLQAESRRLPVVLFSPGEETAFDYYEKETLVSAFGGIAHLIKLADPPAVAAFSRLMPNHKCYNGATRLYWPGYRPGAPALEYPYWRSKDQKYVFHQLVLRLGRASWFIVDRNEEINQLQGQQRKEYQESETFYRKGLEAIGKKNRAEEKVAEWARLVEAADDVLATKDNQIAELQAELKRISDDNRRLRWELNAAWQGTQEETEDVVDEPLLYLSGYASDVFEALDGSDRDYWEQHVLAKLLNRQQRNAQSEPVRGNDSEKCFVYPRGSSAGGRRVIYFCEEDDVYVCELLTHDLRYQKIRTYGVDSAEYTDFLPWQGGKLILHEAPPSYTIDQNPAGSGLFEALADSN